MYIWKIVFIPSSGAAFTLKASSREFASAAMCEEDLWFNSGDLDVPDMPGVTYRFIYDLDTGVEYEFGAFEQCANVCCIGAVFKKARF